MQNKKTALLFFQTTIFIFCLITSLWAQTPAGTGNTGAGNTGSGNTGGNANRGTTAPAAKGAGGRVGAQIGEKAIENQKQKLPAAVQQAAGAAQQAAGAAQVPNPLPVVQLEDPLNPNQAAVMPVAGAIAPEILALRQKIYGYQIFNNPNVVWAPAENIATPRDYTIGPTDELNLNIWGFSQAKYDLKVTAEGFVEVPRGGNVMLAGRTIEQAQKELIQRLSPYFLNLGTPSSGGNTFLQLTLGKIRTIRVTVLGEVITPGVYNISSLSTALNALYLTGGPNENGSFREIKVVRKNKTAATVDIYELLMNGTLSSDVRLQDNDVIMVSPFKKRIELIGNVKRPGLYEILAEEPIKKAFDYAGGFSQDAYTSRIKVVGITEKEHRITDVTSEEFGTYLPKNGDEVTITPVLERFANMVIINGAVYRPGQYSLEQNKTLLQLIKNADGLTGDAFTGRINIIRTLEDLSVENISLNLAELLGGKVADIELKREDEILIPSKFDLRQAATINIAGEVNFGDTEIPYSSNLTLEDAIIRAGGFKESAATAQIDVVRRKNNVKVQTAGAQIAEVFAFNINRDLSMGPDDSKFFLEPFDEIIVRKASNYQEQIFITLEGEVVNPGKYGIKSKDEKMSDLIQRAGGLTPQAYINGATLIRTVKLSDEEIARRKKLVNVIANDDDKGNLEAEEINKDTKEAVGISLAKIMEDPGGKEDLLLEDADIIRVPKRLETVRLDGDLLFPTTVKFRDANTFMDYVSQAGGFTKTSLKRKSYVIYPNGSVDRTRRFLVFNRYPKVEPGSEIIVPQRKVTGIEETQQTIGIITGFSQAVLVMISTILAFKAFTK